MKNLTAKLLMFLLAFILYGCPNEGPYHTYTRINADGSCYRELIRSADSLFVADKDTAHNPFPMKIDSTWKLAFYKRTANDSSVFRNFPTSQSYITNGEEYSWFVTARKDYPSVDSMAANFHFDNSGWDSLKTQIQFEKKFRWFYTYYEFSEVFPPVNPFTIIPVSEYLNDQEVAALYGEDKELFKGKNGFEMKSMLDDLSRKADVWMQRCFFEELFLVYSQNLGLFHAPIDRETFMAEKDTIYKYYFLKDTFDMDNIDVVLDHHFHTSAFSSVESFEIDSLFENKFPDFLRYSEVELNYKLSMPGKIIQTNAPFLQNDTLSWRVEDDRFFFNSYTLNAFSRKPNFWAFAATGFIVVLSVLGFMIKKK